MMDEFRQTGINVIGTVPWGTHFCQFYQTKEDLLDILIPYFKAGLEDNEFCMWVTAEPLSAEEAREAMLRSMPDFADRLSKGQIEILPHTDWYLKDGFFDQQRVLNGWVEKLSSALKAGYTGLRLTGNTFWLEKRDWKGFTNYEAAVNDVIGKYHMLALCTYSLDKCGASEVMDVIRNHEFALIRRGGKWELIENAIHKQAKESLLESEERHRKVFEAAMDGLWVTDLSGRFLQVNDSYCQISGYTRQELLNMRISDIEAAENPEETAAHIKKVFQQGQDRFETRHRCKDGKLIDIEVSVKYSDVMGGQLIVSARDITERKRVEKALRETSDYLDNLLNYANAPIIVWDPKFHITRFNRAFERLTGYNASEVLGKKLDILFPAQTRKESLNHIRRTVSGERWEAIEIPILRTDDSVRTVLWNSATLYAPDGKTVIATIAQGQDITERKRAEEQLRETRDYLDNLLNYANAPIIVWDPKFHITRFNHAFERLTGYDASEVLGKKLDILFPAQTRKESLDHIRRTASGERWEVVEIPILRVDGAVQTVLWNSATLYDSDGKTVIATIAQGQDITERKQAEQELSKQAFMLTHISDAVMGMDLDYRINYWSPSAEQMYGYGAAEAIGKTALELIKPVYVGKERDEVLQQLTSTGYTEAEYIHERKSGGKLNIEMRATLLRDDRGEPFGIIGVNRDITERRREEEIEHIGDMGIWDWNVATGELQWSDQIYTMFGLKPKQFAATYESFLNYVHPDDRKKVQLAINQALHNTKQYDIEHRIVRPDGSIHIVHERAQVYLNRKGKPARMMGTVQDITKRKAVEEKLRRLSRSLVDIQEAERRDIARELHDGLAQSLATVRILLDRGAKPSIDVGPIINQARDVVQDVIDQVREMSLNLRPSMLDDLGLLPALQWHFEQVLSRTGIRINFKYSGLKLAESKGLPTEVRTAVYRIIQEAISNAIRHAQADEVNVSIRIRNDILHLLVEDHGKGFDIDAMPDVSSGLSTMQERASLCGGSLTINSAPDAGTRISAEIPLFRKET